MASVRIYVAGGCRSGPAASAWQPSNVPLLGKVINQPILHTYGIYVYIQTSHLPPSGYLIIDRLLRNGKFLPGSNCVCQCLFGGYRGYIESFNVGIYIMLGVDTLQHKH